MFLDLLRPQYHVVKVITLPNRRLRSAPGMEQEHDQKESAKPFAVIQGASGGRGAQRRQDAGGIGAAVRYTSEPDHRLEGATIGALSTSLRQQRSRTDLAGKSNTYTLDRQTACGASVCQQPHAAQPVSGKAG